LCFTGYVHADILDAFELRDYTLMHDTIRTQTSAKTIELVVYSEKGQLIEKLTETDSSTEEFS